MSFLDQLTDHQRSLLVALPYRVGLYVSQSEDAGGDDADEREMQALSNIVTGFAYDVFGSEIVQYIMSETLAHKDQWEEWEDDIAAIPSECETAISILVEYGGPKDIAAFQNHMMEIGGAVAMAFNEYESDTALEKCASQIGYCVQTLRTMLSGGRRQSASEYLSVSKNERRALDALAKGLKG